MGVQDALWNEFGDATIETMVDGANVLAAIWSACLDGWRWTEDWASALESIDAATLPTRYNDRSFVRSLTLDEVADELV